MKFLHCIINFVGHRLQTPRWYKYRKSVEPLFAYSLSRGSGMPLLTRINNECPRRYVHRCETQRIKHTKGHLSLSWFGLVKFSGFRDTKTSANKRLLIMSANFCLAVQRYYKICGCANFEWKSFKIPHVERLFQYQ